MTTLYIVNESFSNAQMTLEQPICMYTNPIDAIQDANARNGYVDAIQADVFVKKGQKLYVIIEYAESNFFYSRLCVVGIFTSRKQAIEYGKNQGCEYGIIPPFHDESKYTIGSINVL